MYLLTISLPDIDNVAMSLYDIIHMCSACNDRQKGVPNFSEWQYALHIAILLEVEILNED